MEGGGDMHGLGNDLLVQNKESLLKTHVQIYVW